MTHLYNHHCSFISSLCIHLPCTSLFQGGCLLSASWVYERFSIDSDFTALYLWFHAFDRSHFLCSRFVMTSLYSTVPLTYSCGHLWDIKKMIWSLQLKDVQQGLPYRSSYGVARMEPWKLLLDANSTREIEVYQLFYWSITYILITSYKNWLTP